MYTCYTSWFNFTFHHLAGTNPLSVRCKVPEAPPEEAKAARLSPRSDEEEEKALAPRAVKEPVKLGKVLLLLLLLLLL